MQALVKENALSEVTSQSVVVEYISNDSSSRDEILQWPEWMRNISATGSTDDNFSKKMHKVIPEAMRKASRWLVHRNKQPFYIDGNPRSGELDTPEEIERLSTFDDALKAYATGSYNGLGFALGGGWQGIDLDKVELHGLSGIVDELPCYVERSPSGKGFHAIGFGRSFPTLGANSSGIEAYAGKRYFTVTGDVYYSAEIKCLADFVEQRLSPLHSKMLTTIERNTIDGDIIEGGRNHALTSMAGTMRSRGMSRSAIEAALLAENATRCHPPLPDNEVKTIAKSVSRYEPSRDAINDDASSLFNPIKPERFCLETAAQVANRPMGEYLIKGVLPRKGIAAIYGPSGVGKSFFATTMFFSVAAGKPWQGHKVKQVPVVIVCLEGEGGLPARIKAYETKNDLIHENVRFLTGGFSFLNDKDIAALAEVINGDEMGGGVILIDTLNRAAPSIDENSSEGMGRVIGGAKRLQTLCGGLVVLVHHTGKDASKGLRGHSSLIAALDASIEVQRDGEIRKWTLSKSKDGADGDEHQFKLEVVQIGIDEDSEPVTSCVVVPVLKSFNQSPQQKREQFKIRLAEFVESEFIAGRHHSATDLQHFHKQLDMPRDDLRIAVIDLKSDTRFTYDEGGGGKKGAHFKLLEHAASIRTPT